MVFSAIFLAIGGTILRTEDLVPLSLTFSTAGTIILILVVAHFVNLGKKLAMHLGVALGVISIVFNVSQPTHVNAILHPVLTIPFMVLVASEILGFFLLPALYFIFYALEMGRTRGIERSGAGEPPS